MAEERQAFLEATECHKYMGTKFTGIFFTIKLQVVSRIAGVEAPVHDYAAFTPTNPAKPTLIQTT